jgi:hypothetical protein
LRVVELQFVEFVQFEQLRWVFVELSDSGRCRVDHAGCEPGSALAESRSRIRGIPPIDGTEARTPFFLMVGCRSALSILHRP